MERDDRLSGTEILAWATAGVGAGLAVGFIARRVDGRGQPRPRARRGAASASRRTAPAHSRRIRASRRSRHSRRSAARALGIEVVSFSRGVVELRGWVPTRTARALAGRAALAAPGIDSVINSILVHGEDDQAMRKAPRPTDQSA